MRGPGMVLSVGSANVELSIGTIVLSVEDIVRAGDFWRVASGYVNRGEPSEDRAILDPADKTGWDAPGTSIALTDALVGLPIPISGGRRTPGSTSTATGTSLPTSAGPHGGTLRSSKM